MKKVHVLLLGCHPQKNGHHQTTLTPILRGSPKPAASLALMWLVGWAGWVLGALPQCHDLSS